MFIYIRILPFSKNTDNLLLILSCILSVLHSKYSAYKIPLNRHLFSLTNYTPYLLIDIFLHHHLLHLIYLPNINRYLITRWTLSCPVISLKFSHTSRIACSTWSLHYSFTKLLCILRTIPQPFYQWYIIQSSGFPLISLYTYKNYLTQPFLLIFSFFHLPLQSEVITMYFITFAFLSRLQISILNSLLNWHYLRLCYIYLRPLFLYTVYYSLHANTEHTCFQVISKKQFRRMYFLRCCWVGICFIQFS